MTISLIVSEIFNVKNIATLKSRSGVNQSHWKWYTIRYTGYGSLLVFYNNFVPKIFEIFDFKNAVTLKTRLGVRQGHWKYHRSMSFY